ncbi:S8 family serine peptidase [Candidatus Gottesmanbacteria bacterium]|nr:S8 family serine peptidase [Candidatus Gottesmanbacteria bacterium]
MLSLLLFGRGLLKTSYGQDKKPNVLPDQYIVVLKDSVDDSENAAEDLQKKHNLSIDFIYKKALKGFSAKMNTEKLEKVKADPRVLFVSEDREVTYAVKEDGVRGNGRKPKPRPTPTQPPQKVPTGISRIGLNSTNEGVGIGVAVIDTGVDLTHPDLAANIPLNANTTCVTGTSNGNDDNGHGTHVAGTIAALNNSIGVIGVAPQAKILAVKVLNAQGSGTWSSVICGIDWVTANAGKFTIKVANMSLGAGGSSDNNCGNSNSDPLHKAICNSRNAGVTYVVAAGNSGANASGFVPAAYDDAVITVSALADSDGQSGGVGTATAYGSDDTFATFSNYGTVVDLGAPGVSIFSTYYGGDYGTLSGTSMASPHVAGAAALYLNKNPGDTWSQVRDGLKAVAEVKGNGHTDPSGLHPEPVVRANAL